MKLMTFNYVNPWLEKNEVLVLSKQVVEYLYYSKKEPLENIEEIFREVMSNFLRESQLQCELKGKKLVFHFDIVSYGDSLNVTFSYDKSGQIGLGEIRTFQNILEDINIEASKAKLNHTTLLDTTSLFFSKKLLPYLHSYEWAMRKLIYLVSPTYFSKDWVEKSISKKKSLI